MRRTKEQIAARRQRRAERERFEMGRLLLRFDEWGELEPKDRLGACLAIARGYLESVVDRPGWADGLLLTDAGRELVEEARATEARVRKLLEDVE